MERKDDGSFILSREELYDRVWNTPVVRLAKEFGLSDVGLAKICMRHEIPRPPLGYWAKKKYGKETHRTELPELRDRIRSRITIRPPRKRANKVPLKKAQPPEEDITVAAKLVSPHPLVARTKKAFENTHVWSGIMTPSGKARHLNIHVSKDSLNRALKILDAILKAVEGKGHKVSVSTNPTILTEVTVQNEKIAFSMWESARRAEHIPNEQEKRLQDKSDFYSVNKCDYFPSGQMTLSIDGVSGMRTKWSDGKKQQLEDCLGAFVASLSVAAEKKKIDRAENERRDRQRQEEQLRHEEAEMRRYEEEEKVKKLREQIENWQESQRIRAFLKAVETANRERGQKIEPGSELEKGILWASEYADKIDPLTPSSN